jgi:riboflavin biosynthesis pyrimidine reductase/pyrimidine deaminase RibD-like protein
MNERPYVLLSCAMSVDGCLDAPGRERLVLSGAADLDRVDGERASSDAIMVGAGTIRRDDPRLLIRSPERRAARVASGRPAHPARITLTASGDLDPRARFFSGPEPDADPGPPPARLVYCATPVAARVRRRIGSLAEVVAVGAGADVGGGADVDGGTDVAGGANVGSAEGAGDRPALAAVLADLSRRGIRRLMVEGGADLSRQFLTAGLADELQLVIAPFFVGDPGAPRFAGPGRYPYGPSRPMALAEVREVGAVVLLRYLLAGPADGPPPAAGGDAAAWAGAAETLPGHGPPGPCREATAADRGWLSEAIGLSRLCPPSATAFAVGAVVVAGDGSVLAAGYSREGSPHDHAEEAALAKLDPADPRLGGATLYSSLEPCRFRASRPRPCAELIIGAGLRRVVIAWREPPVFAPGGGAALLAEAGITVVEIADLAPQARAVNAGLLGG